MARLLHTKRMLPTFSQYPSRIFKNYLSFCEQGKSTVRDNESCAPADCSKSTHKPNNHHHGIKLPTILPTSNNHLDGFSIDLVDPDIWPQSLGSMDKVTGSLETLKENEMVDKMSNGDTKENELMDFDEIEDLRLRRKLFYKLDRESKEFEEYNVNFPRKKTLKKERGKLTRDEMKKECKKMENTTKADVKKEQKKMDSVKPNDGSCKELNVEGKRVRTPTFNQLTGPYHLPFCLDIFITKGSVRASIIHRVTSKVVAVAHSISKDLKFDLGSRKDGKACAAVGGVLAQRAIEDDIHNVVYTPRKGDKIEGKLQIVLQSVIDNGIDVKVKLKQKRPMKKTQA